MRNVDGFRPKINNASVTSSTSVYAPAGAGTAGQYLVSAGGTAAPVWQAPNTDFVNLSTAQTVAGVKTFSSSPIVPTPSLPA
jgi:hypothetical protein